jgi:hypothetical protein
MLPQMTRQGRKASPVESDAQAYNLSTGMDAQNGTIAPDWVPTGPGLATDWV